MNAKKVASILFAILGGAVILGIIGFLVWALVMRGDSEPAPHEQADFEAPAEETLVNVYFPGEETASDEIELEETQRSTDRTDLIAYTMEEMIAGPDEEERARGLYSELELDDTSESTCGGDDFTVEADDGAILIQLCRDAVNYKDSGSDSVAVAQISQTMSQFPDVNSGQLFIFDKDRNCYGDTDGVNECHDDLPAGITP